MRWHRQELPWYDVQPLPGQWRKAASVRIYLAARFVRQAEMRDKRAALLSMGHECTSRWLDEESEMLSPELDSAGLFHAQRFAATDITDVLAAEALILFTEGPDVVGRARGGRHVEFGYALGRGKVCVVVGPFENVFTTMVPRFDDLPGAVQFLEALR